MELVLNLAWLALCLGLLVFFGPSLKKPAAGRTRGVALVAMLCILFLLFPVISVTDDIAMCTAPRDAERALRLHDPFDSSQPTPTLLPSTMAWMDTIFLMLRTGPSRPVEQGATLTILLAGAMFPVDSRPPPATL